MNRELISRVFRRDFRKLLEFDIFELTDDLEYLIQKEYFSDLFIGAVRQPIIQLTTNLIELVVNFFEYDGDKFPNPQDQYVYIYENQERILEVLAQNLKVDCPFDCPLSYTLGFRINSRFERLFNHILTVGNTHKFDEDYILEHILTDSDEPETD